MKSGNRCQNLARLAAQAGKTASPTSPVVPRSPVFPSPLSIRLSSPNPPLKSQRTGING